MDSSKDELAVLAASGQVVEHDVPGWQERLRLHRLELSVSRENTRLAGQAPRVALFLLFTCVRCEGLRRVSALPYT